MAITQTLCTSFKKELFEAVHNFTSHTFNVALYTSSATLGASTTAYSAGDVGQVANGNGYSTGGKALTVVGGSVSTSGTTVFVDFDNVSWTSASFTARGALIYNTSVSNKAVAVLDFGGDKAVVSSTFEIQFPTADALSAIIRIA